MRASRPEMAGQAAARRGAGKSRGCGALPLALLAIAAAGCAASPDTYGLRAVHEAPRTIEQTHVDAAVAVAFSERFAAHHAWLRGWETPAPAGALRGELRAEVLGLDDAGARGLVLVPEPGKQLDPRMRLLLCTIRVEQLPPGHDPERVRTFLLDLLDSGMLLELVALEVLRGARSDRERMELLSFLTSRVPYAAEWIFEELEALADAEAEAETGFEGLLRAAARRIEPYAADPTLRGLPPRAERQPAAD